MSFFNFFINVSLLSSAILAHAGVTPKDFSGVGHIYVLNSSDSKTANPEQKVGCLDNDGRFIADQSTQECGTFSRLNEYPYTLSSKQGNCTFRDEKTVANTDSYYGKNDHAWTCNATYIANIYDELYTIGFKYPFLCFGDIACYYDAKSIPDHGEKMALWQYHWGSHQRGITPGHVMLQLMWNKTGGLPMSEGDKIVSSPRIEGPADRQVPLQEKYVK